MDYLGLSAVEQRVYDNKVQDKLVAALMIKGCKYNSLREWLKNQQLAPGTGTECAYPKTSSGAVKLIDNGNWGKETGDGKRRGHNNPRKQEASEEDIIGSHVHDNNEDDDDETETMKHVMATIGSTGIEHRNAYEPIQNKEEFDDESIGEVVGSITTTIDRLPNIPEQDRYKLVDHTHFIYDDIRDLKDRDHGLSISDRLELECEYFTGGGMSHGPGCDFHPQLYPHEEREHARRMKFEPSPNSDSLISLKVLLHRLALLGEEEKCDATKMENDLNTAGIACVTDLYNAMTKNRITADYEGIANKYKEHGIPRLNDITVIYLRGMAQWMNTRYNADHEYYLQMAAIMDEQNEHVVGGIVTYESESEEESEYSDDDSIMNSSMPSLVPRSDHLSDSDDDSANRNYFTFQDDSSSDDDNSTATNEDTDDESVYSITTATVIKNIEEINMKVRKQGYIQMETHVYPHNKQDLLCSTRKPVSLGGIENKSHAAMIEYRRTFGGMIRTNIKLVKEKAPCGIYTLHPFLKKKPAVIEAEKNRTLDDDNVYATGFENSYPYTDPTDPFCKAVFGPGRCLSAMDFQKGKE